MKTKQYFVSTNREKVEAKKVKLGTESDRNLKNFLGLKNSDQPVYLFQAGTTKER